MYAAEQWDLSAMLKIVVDFSENVEVRFGVEKRRIMAINAGKAVPNNIHVDANENEDTMKTLLEGETYKYLGVEQRNATEQ